MPAIKLHTMFFAQAQELADVLITHALKGLSPAFWAF
jgi:hypothetical protein